MSIEGERSYSGFDIRSPFRSYFRVLWSLVSTPERFFREARGGRLSGATWFLFLSILSITSFSATILIMFLALIGVVPPTIQGVDDRKVTLIIAMLIPVVLLLYSLVSVIFTFASALLWHPLVALSVGVGGGHGYKETYRIVAYTSVFFLMGSSIPAFFIPVVGGLVFWGFGAYVRVRAIRAAHDTTIWRALFAIATPILAVLVLLGTLSFVVYLTGSNRPG